MPDKTLEPVLTATSLDAPYGDPPAISNTDTTLAEARRFWKIVKDHPMEKTFREQALVNIKYFTGEDQGWDEDGSRAKLEKEGRPSLTLNRTHPIIRLICGARPKLRVTYVPAEQGKEDTASILASCKEYVDDYNKWQYQEDDLLLKALIVRRGIISIMPDYERDPRGEIKLSLENPANVYLDPDSEERDRTDMQRMILIKHVTIAEAKRMFPKKKADIDRLAQQVESNAPSTIARDISSVDGYVDDSPADYYQPTSKKISLIYYWYKTYENATKIIDLATGQVTDSKLPAEEAKKKLADIKGADRFRVIERQFTRVRWLVFAHDIEFERGITPWERKDGQRTLLSDNLPFVVEELSRIVFGLQQFVVDFMTMLRDPAKYHNKLASSILHIINTQARGGYDYQKGALSDEQKKHLEQEGSKPGHNQEWDNLANMKPRSPSAAPTAEMALAQTMSRELLDISGVESLVSTQSLGKNASGYAIETKQRQGGNIISWIYEAHSFFMHQLADYVRDAIQALYDYEKVVRLRGDKPNYVTINKKVYDQMGGIAQVMNDVTEGRYATRVRDKEDMPTVKLERFKYFSEMVKSGALQLPPQVMTKIVLMLMDDPDLQDMVQEEFGEYMKQQQQIAAQSKKLPPAIREDVDIDRLLPLLTANERAQVLQEIGINPDPNASVVGQPTASEAMKTSSAAMIAEKKMAAQAAMSMQNTNEEGRV